MAKTQVYLDNAATTRMKPPSVYHAVEQAARHGFSPGRGGYEGALAAGRSVITAREKLAQLFGSPSLENVTFTYNITYALNFALQGLLKPGDHVITTSMEHNAVLRPLRALETRGVDVSVVPCNHKGEVDFAALAKAVAPNTTTLVTTHASNVTGTLFPVDALGEFARKHKLIFVLDTAQTAGIYPVNCQEQAIDVLAFTGHKTLMGPPGTGGLVINKRAAARIRPLIHGGTGSNSELEYQPEFYPDRLESGTINTWGIAGLQAGVEFVSEHREQIIKHERELTEAFMQGVAELPGVCIHGVSEQTQRTSVVSLTVDGWDLGELAFCLDDQYGIMVRSGLHCAPLAHKTLGTYPEGTLRFSFGFYNTIAEIVYTLDALGRILKAT